MAPRMEYIDSNAWWQLRRIQGRQQGQGSRSARTRRGAQVSDDDSSCNVDEEERGTSVHEYVEETSKEREIARRAISEGVLLELGACDVGRFFVSHYTGWSSEGAFGHVVGTRVAGFGVEIKRWDWLKVEGLDHVEHEIQVYRTVLERNPELLRDVPRVFVIAKEPREEFSLVMECVGSEVERGCEESEGGAGSDETKRSWYVDGVRLSKREEEEISEAQRA